MPTVRLLPFDETNSGKQKMAILMIAKNGSNERLNLVSPTDLTLNMGDSIRCISGSAVAMMNPGSPAGAYILTTKVSGNDDEKYVTLLPINPHTLRARPRAGKIEFDADIGNTARAAGAFTR